MYKGYEGREWDSKLYALMGPSVRLDHPKNNPYIAGFHNGVDIYLPQGGDAALQANAQYYAPENGTVRYSYYSAADIPSRKAAGNIIEYDFQYSKQDYRMRILHAKADQEFQNKFRPGVDYKITRGQSIGFFGGSGVPYSSWVRQYPNRFPGGKYVPHCHVEILKRNKQDGRYRHYDPTKHLLSLMIK